jgi:hypothetical protein
MTLDLEDAFEAHAVGELDLLEHLVVNLALVIGVPGVRVARFGQLQLVEQSELHWEPPNPASGVNGLGRRSSRMSFIRVSTRCFTPGWVRM